MAFAQVSISPMDTQPSASAAGSRGPAGPYSRHGMPASHRCPVSSLAREPVGWTPTESAGLPVTVSTWRATTPTIG